MSAPVPVLDAVGEWQSFSPGLERVNQALDMIGRPTYPIILVGGTNGKGTLTWNLARNLEGRCGLFQSPHLTDVRERITLAGSWLPDETWRETFHDLRQCLPHPEPNKQFSYFEWVFLLAVRMFERIGVDCAVFEIGLGGRLDACNAIDPMLSILTNVSLDHREILGDSVEQIALEKIEIARAQKPFLAPTSVVAMPAIQQRLNTINSKLHTHQAQTYEDLADLARQALILSGLPHREPLIEPPPGRRQKLGEHIWVDGAHNPAGWQTLVDWIRTQTDTPINVLAALSKGRNPEEFLAIMGPIAKQVHVWNVVFEKALPIDAWSDKVHMVETTDLAELCQTPLLVCGSLYMIGLFHTFVDEELFSKDTEKRGKEA